MRDDIEELPDEGLKIGEFLAEVGIMNLSDVDNILAMQTEGDSRMFGEIAISLGLIDDEALKLFLKYKNGGIDK
jgi:hypothetical protein